MFVIEHRHGPSTLAEDVGDFEEHFEARIQLLGFLILRIVAVFANQQHSVDGEAFASQRKGFLHGAKDGYVVLLCTVAAHVLLLGPAR